MINFYLVADPNQHICELQLVHNMMMTARKGLPGHAVYNRVRNANEFLLVLPKEQPQDKEELQAWLIEYHAGNKLKHGDPNLWDVSKIKDMSALFHPDALRDFNEDIGDWDVSNVENMELMFYKAKAFNQTIEKWDVSKVENMKGMFQGAEAFNQPIEKWDVSKVENMVGMFREAKAFNQPIENWDVSKVKNMRSMFEGAEAFNQSLPGGWKLEDLK